PGCTDSIVFSAALARLLHRWFDFEPDCRAAQKRIPEQLLSAEEDVQWAFLSGLFEGDAYVSTSLPHIEYTTASQRLAVQVTSLLLRLGIFALLRQHEKFASNTKARVLRTYYSVFIYGNEQLARVAERLTFVGEKQTRLERLRSMARTTANPNLDLVPG